MPELKTSEMLERVNKVLEGESLVVNLPDAAKLLGISRGTAYAIAGQPGGIPVLRLGDKRMVVPKAALLKMLEDAAKVTAP